MCGCVAVSSFCSPLVGSPPVAVAVFSERVSLVVVRADGPHLLVCRRRRPPGRAVLEAGTPRELAGPPPRQLQPQSLVVEQSSVLDRKSQPLPRRHPGHQGSLTQFNGLQMADGVTRVSCSGMAIASAWRR